MNEPDHRVGVMAVLEVSLKGMVRPENFYPPLELAQKTCKNMYLGHFYQDWKWVQYSTACVKDLRHRSFCEICDVVEAIESLWILGISVRGLA